MKSYQKNSLDVILPVFNEAGSISQVVEEVYKELASQLETRLIICEDGSTDGTKDVLIKLSESYPITLVMSEQRKGYSQAVIDGIRVTEAPLILFLDSDGQYDPRDFRLFWQLINRYDLIIGRRFNRSDSRRRLFMSRSFKFIHDLLFHVPVHDPSCPFVLVKKHIADGLLVPRLGLLRVGFWWEFTARAYRQGVSMQEVAINHRKRFSGDTHVYGLRKVPGIAISHLFGLLKIWLEVRSSELSKFHSLV